jgi:hypothetical protein
LLLLPGGLLLLVPWRVRPFLSMAFWGASWWWLPRLGPGRTASLCAALLAFGLLALLRLLKPIDLRQSGLALLGSAGVLALSAVLLVWGAWPLPRDAAFDALSARLLAARDGLPLSYEPLLPGASLEPRPPGLAAWAADISLLSGAAPWRASVVAIASAQVLLGLGAFHRLRRRLSAGRAAVAALALTLAVVLPGVLSGGNLLALGAALVAWNHLPSPTRSPAVAAGVLCGAAVLFGGVDLVAVVLGIGLLESLRQPQPNRAAACRGMALATGVCLALVLPALSRVGPMSLVEVCALGRMLCPVRSVQRLPESREIAEWVELGSKIGPLDIVCAPDTSSAAWIPAVAGRAVVVDGRLRPFPDGHVAPPPSRRCAIHLDGSNPSKLRP